MTLSIHQVAVPPVLKMLNNITAWLDKAAAFCAARKMDEQLLLNTRLYPDMFPFARQVQSVSDHAKGLAARLAGHEVPSFPDTEASIADLKARIAKTAEFVQSLPAAAFEGAEARTVTLVFGGGRKVELSGQDYLSHGAFPNFYFHAATAYDILRHLGVEIGKRDFLG